MSPSVAPVRRSGSIARRNARSRAAVRTRSVSPPILSSLLGNTAAMAIARSPNCCAGGLDNQRQAGRAYLATRGAEGPASAAQARQALADQRILHPAAAGAAQSCLVL